MTAEIIELQRAANERKDRLRHIEENVERIDRHMVRLTLMVYFILVMTMIEVGRQLMR